jgi:hypothetical protein
VSVSAAVFAAPPYEIRGLHVDMVFNDAMSRAEELGGACEPGTHRRGEAFVARCDYTACAARGGNAQCPGSGVEGISWDLEAVAIVSIGFEAATPAARLSRIAIVFDGDADAVAESLVREYGPPDDTTGTGWSNSRRLFWMTGESNLSLLKNRRTIMLTTNRPVRPPAHP